MVATIIDVAKKAGVSASTVSKVLKNYTTISDATKKKVLEAIKELNYIPNLTASNLSSKKTEKVALYIYINDLKQAVDEINMQYLQGAFEQAKEINLDVVTIFNQTVHDYTPEELSRYFIAQGINAIVVYGLNKEDTVIHEIINSGQFLVTVVDAPIVNDITSSVIVDHIQGQYDVAKALLEKDPCHKVLYLAGKQNGYVTDMRIQGIQKLQNEFGFDLNIQYAEFSEKKAYELTQRYASDADAVVCASDLMAIGAVNALINMNIFRRCCGYDGITLMGYVGKQMLTCKQDFYETSKQAVLEIKRLLEGEKGRQRLLNYEVKVIKYDDVIM
ncbi:LacI family DNA-binding transcriptional regulator [Anaerorhabdus sp.]|uniref:LacI family DNA-binding transcriptional regulator n=1 Tax=Anaerorhabdus sp. TaxID=1872524 RepID=UPI002FC64D91